MTRLAVVRRALAILLLALWWGGFSFYAGRVVFIGHQVLESKIRQGFITERVTVELNWLCLAALAMVAWELCSSGGYSRKRAIWSGWLAVLVTTIVLFFLHTKLNGMLNFPVRQVADEDHFYNWHRIYLLIATVQWGAGAVLVVLFQVFSLK